MSWRRTNYDRHEAMLAKAKKVLHKAGYRAVFEQRFDIDMNSHMCGTAVAGTDPAHERHRAVVPAHDVPNLFVVDSAFFPSSGAQNPALTIAAQALRVAASPTGTPSPDGPNKEEHDEASERRGGRSGDRGRRAGGRVRCWGRRSAAARPRTRT